MFREIPGLNDYLVNAKGVVISKRTRKRLSPNNNGNGYYQVQFGDGKNRYVHRLVAMAFIPNPDNKPQVDHIDGNKGNNAAENLRWVTVSENVRSAGHEERCENKQCPVTAENIVTGEIINFRSRNACARYFKCDKSKIKYGWVYQKGNKKNWLITQDIR